MKKLQIKLLSANATIPTRTHEHDAGLDIYSAEEVLLKPQEKCVLVTDLAVNIPPGYVGLLTSRSGVSSKTDIVIETGKIDAGYHGNLGVNIKNDSGYSGERVYGLYDVKGEYDHEDASYPLKTYHIKEGDKIAQLLIVPIVTAEISIVDDFSEYSSRGKNGFGSTGY